MTKPVTIPNTFATATTAIPLSQLDSDFSTVATALNDANTYSNYAADTGVANAYVVTLTGVSTTYSAGLRIQFKAGNANTGASTLNVNGGGTKNITFQDASALSSGTIAANAIVDVMYDGTQFLLMNDPAGTVGTGDVVGPAGATANAAAIFDSTTGKLIKDSKVIITPVANSSTLTIANNKTVTVNNTLTLSGTDSTTMTFPSTSATIARTDSAQTFTGVQTFSSDASINGITVGRGAGAVSTNTAVGASALAANTTGAQNNAFGSLALTSITSSGFSDAFGYTALQYNTGAANAAFGNSAMRGVSGSSTGGSNAAFGASALLGLTSGSYNTAIGVSALQTNTTASNNTAVGYQAGYSNTTGTQNNFFGTQAGYSSTTDNQAFFGYQAGYNTTTGTQNTVMGGYRPFFSNTTGAYNTVFGSQALYSNTTASNNTAVGYQAGYSGTTTLENTFVGFQAGFSVTTGTGRSVFVGLGAGYSTTTGLDNVAVGMKALYSNTTGGQNVAIGSGEYGVSLHAGYYVTGSKNTLIGYTAGSAITTGSKNTVLGGYTGNQGGLDIRTASNYIVLSDGDGNPRAYCDSTGYWQIQAAGITNNANSAALRINGGSGSFIAQFFGVTGGGENVANSAMGISKDNATSRSINAGGTINASGADYAEYMTKAGDFTLAKGDVVGVDATGKLTNIFADAISFVVKSTDPSYVGGDVWGTEEAIGCKKPDNNATQEEKEKFEVALEAARQRVDRIAFAGQVPVNVMGATAGQYIVPINDNGAIKGQAVSNPTFEQYQTAVGKVIAIEPDGRAKIIVKVA